VSRAAGTGDDGAKATLAGGFGVFEEPIRGAVRTDDTRLVGNFKRAQNFNGG
jgi:hypothetical protein